jgi:hypothetical protein
MLDRHDFNAKARSCRTLVSGLAVLAAFLVVPALASANLAVTSHGGPLETNPAVFEIYWGNAWNSGTPATERSKLQSMYNDFNESGGSGWRGILTQYWAPQAPAHPREGTAFKFVSPSTTVGTPYTDPTGPPASITKANMEAEVKRAIEAQGGAGAWPETLAKANLNDQFVLFTPPGTTWSTEVSKSACGEHLHSGESYVYARVAWEYEKEGLHLCSVTTAASHEFAESVTDPVYNAWRNWEFEEQEIADLCEFEGRGEFPGGIEVAKLWDNHTEKLAKCQTSDPSPPQIPPEILTEAATGLTATSATLHGGLVANGLAASHGRFDWATTKEWESSESYGHHSASESFFGSGEKRQIGTGISGLAPATTYHYRLVAENNGGFPEISETGKDQTFRTAGPPVVVTENATQTNSFEPQLNAAVNPEGLSTTYQFEYGLTTAYGLKVPAVGEAVGSGRESVAVSQILKGLERNKTYHYRVVATNSSGTTKGADKAFTTLPPCKGAEEKCSWSTQTTANPAPFSQTRLSDTSCPTATLCVAVGTDEYTGKGLAENWNGTQWKLIKGTSVKFGDAVLASISCTSTTFCMVISGQNQAWELAYEPISNLWSTAALTPPTPSGATVVVLRDVSCSAEAACTATGYYKNGAGEFKTLADRWNGSAWTQQPTPSPTEGSGPDATQSVSCPSATSCIAVGEAANKPFAESWNGSEWSIVSIPNPAGATSASLAGVSCTSANACSAVGSFMEAGKPAKTLAEIWNGASWSIKASPNPAGAKGDVRLGAVSCLSAGSCFAVGHYVTALSEFGSPTEEQTLAESWNGTEWALQASPSPEKASTLAGVSCSSSIVCTAVGSGRPEPGGNVSTTLAERYE